MNNMRLENRQLKKQLTSQLQTLASVERLLQAAAIEAKRNINVAIKNSHNVSRNLRAVRHQLAKYKD